MKKGVGNIALLVSSFFVVMMSSGVSVSMHYCCGGLVDVGIHKATCGMENGGESSIPLFHKTCCESHAYILQLDDTVNADASVVPLSLVMTPLFVVPTAVQVDGFPVCRPKNIFRYRPPPDIGKDITIFQCQLLI